MPRRDIVVGGAGAQEIYTVADKLHKKMQPLHLEGAAINRAARKNAEFATAQDRKRSGSKAEYLVSGEFWDSPRCTNDFFHAVERKQLPF